MRSSKLASFILFISVIFIASCIKKDEYSPIPTIAFKDFVIFEGDSANLIVTFKDGDGNIGLNDDDISGSFAYGNPYYYNVYLIYYYKGIDGKFHRILSPDNSGNLYEINYRIKPDLTPTGKNKSLIGEFLVKLGGNPPIWFIEGHDVVKYEIYIYDRALNKSNVITTPEIIVP